tara:strand:+ start:668 stop:2104 length:1437 start_codon:yes stop_codon:yes gene_type:complete
MASTILKSEIDALLSGNPVYTDSQQEWEYQFESYIGGETYRDGQHLTQYQLESPREYQARLHTTPLENHCQSVVQVYNSFLFRESPKREFGNIEGMPDVESFLRDADLDGRSLNAFMKDVATWSSVFGTCWAIVAKPNVSAQNRAEELDQGVRPYVSMITPLMMLDWSYTRSRTGKYTLDYIKYVEEINGSIKTIKEWTHTEIKTSVVDQDEGIITDDYIEPNGLGMIPAVCVYNKKSTMRGVGVSDIGDIADTQKMIYNLNSEIEQSIRLDSHPSLVTTPTVNIGSGAGALIHMPEDMDPALKPYILSHSGANVDSILKTKESLVESIDKMANTGAVRSTQASTLSGVAMETEFQLLNARLSEKADNLELAEEQIWTLFAYYQGYSWDGEIDYPDSFGIKDIANDIRLMLETRKTLTDPKLIAMFEYEIAEAHFGEDYLEGYDSEMVEHTMTNPATGESITVETQEQHEQLTQQGWV